MSSDSILATVRGRLAAHAPFDRLADELLDRLAVAVEIRYLEADEVLFAEGDAPAGEVFQIQKGSVELERAPTEGDPGLRELCDEGDIVGVRAHLGERPFRATASTREPSLLYVLPMAVLQEVSETAPRFRSQFEATFAADEPLRGEAMSQAISLPPPAPLRGRSRAVFDETRQLDPVREVLTCGPDAPVLVAAQAMAARNVGSILAVDDERCPVGIVTDADLRNRVVAMGLDPAQTRVSEIMSSPVQTVPEGQTLAPLLGAMIRRRIHHLAVTEDGTPNTPVTGVLSEHDILIAQSSHPTFLLNELDRATTNEELRSILDRGAELLEDFVESEVSMPLVASVATALNDRLLRRALALSLEEVGPMPGPFAWMSLGSEGRGEQLLRTDQDNALVYADPEDGDPMAVQERYLELSRRVIDRVVGAGFAPCPADMMASNPEWCLPLSAWTATFDRWMRVPDPKALMNVSIFFDYRAVHGDRSLPSTLTDFIRRRSHEEKRFYPFLAANALANPPPLSFFRGFMVERSGEHKNAFDIKARAMMPLTDAARVLVWDLGLEPAGSTPERFRRLGAAEPRWAQLFDEAAMAYELLMRFRAREGFAHGTSGRFIEIGALNKLERQSLRSTFAVIRDVQRVLSVRYQTDLLRP